MAVSIIERPYLFDFAGNMLAFKLRGNAVNVAGRKAVSRWQIVVMPRVDSYLLLTFADTQFWFDVQTPARATNKTNVLGYYNSMGEMKIELEKKIANNYYISRLYEIVVSDTLEITFTSRNFGGALVDISSSDSQAQIINRLQTEGVERVDKANYQIFAKLEVIRYVNGSIQRAQTPEILLHPNNQNKVMLPLTLLRSYFTQADVPSVSEQFAPYILQYALLTYRLAFSEYYGENPRMQIMQFSDYYYAVSGKMAESNKALNVPDWSTAMGVNVKLSTSLRPRNFGSANNLSINSFWEMPQYAYFMLFSQSENAQYTKTLEVQVDILNNDGTRETNINIGSISISNFNIVRIPLSVNALNLSAHSTDILSYTVRIFSAGYAEFWLRTFILQHKPHFAKVFFLQNRCGVLDSFFTDNEMVEKIIEGDEIVQNGKIEIDITDSSILYTARTGYKTVAEMELLSAAMENRFNYIVIGGNAVPITILPETLVVNDEEQDLQSGEFQYRFNIPFSDKGVNNNQIVIGRDDFERYWQDEIELTGIPQPNVWADDRRYNISLAVNELSER